jgi:hypothetical protein
MTNLLRITVLLGLLLSAGAAQAAFENRADCYAAVIASCNTKAHPEPCTNSGLAQCDAQFPQVVPPPARKLGFKGNQGAAAPAPAGAVRLARTASFVGSSPLGLQSPLTTA